jgi:hypothetical protein
MSADGVASEADAEIVIVGAGEQAPQRGRYHRPRESHPHRSECEQLRIDGQRLPRRLAEDQRLSPCSRCYDDE